jgi:hypothetical protein
MSDWDVVAVVSWVAVLATGLALQGREWVRRHEARSRARLEGRARHKG